MGKRTAESRQRILKKMGKAASTKSGRYHVVQSSEGWIVKKEGTRFSDSVVKRKEFAIDKARKLAGRNGTMIIHAKNGRIVEVRT